MSFGPSIKLTLPLAFLAMLVAFAAWPGSRAAEATLSSISANSLVGGDGDSISITVGAQDDAGGLFTATAAGGGAGTTLAISSCDIAGETGEVCADLDPDIFEITIDTAVVDNSGSDIDATAETLTVVLTLTLDCTDVDQITVTADDPGSGNRSIQVFCVPNDNEPQVVVHKEAASGANFDFDWDASGGNCVVDAEGDVDLDNDGSFTLDNNDRAEFWCEDSVSLVVGEQDDLLFIRIDDCSELTDGVDDISGDSVVFDISDINPGDTVDCTWVNGSVPATPVGGPVASVQVAAPSLMACGTTTAVQVTLRDAFGGPAPAGTSVTATSSLGGSFAPASTLTGTFPFSFATFIYTAPISGTGVTVIRVTAGGITGSANIQITCGAAPAPTTAPVVAVGPLSPPNAGSGGLLGGTSGGDFGAYMPSGLAVSVAALAIGLTLLARRQAMAAPSLVSVALPASKPAARKVKRGGGLAVGVSLLLVAVALLVQRRRS